MVGIALRISLVSLCLLPKSGSVVKSIKQLHTAVLLRNPKLNEASIGESDGLQGIVAIAGNQSRTNALVGLPPVQAGSFPTGIGRLDDFVVLSVANTR